MTKLGILGVLLLSAAAFAAAGRQSVSMKNKQYTPANTTIKAGDTVVWSNNDDHDHTIVADDGSFKSGNIPHAQTFEHQFTKPGTFSYSCSYHPRMRGTVTVTR